MRSVIRHISPVSAGVVGCGQLGTAAVLRLWMDPEGTQTLTRVINIAASARAVLLSQRVATAFAITTKLSKWA